MLNRICGGIVRRCRAIYLKSCGVRILGSSWIKEIEIPQNHFDIELHDAVALERGVTLLAIGLRRESPRISIGERTYINRHSFIDASERISIGRNCMIGPFCYITDHDHGTELGRSISQQPLISKAVQIDDGAWLGAKVVVLKGVTIGEGAIIGAGAVVTKDIPPMSIAVGIPAVVIGSRKSSEMPRHLKGSEFRQS